MLRRDDDQELLRASQSQSNDNDLLTEVEARKNELPMSLAWYRRRRMFGGGPPFIRIANRVFYQRGELRCWIAAHAVDRHHEVRR
jgi:hypothetical protein